jgi:antitoxin component YwqK of YwqJK toxin-antitoxin module
LTISYLKVLYYLPTIPNIRTNYSVSDKADRLRTLLYIPNNGRLYLIDMNMNVIFTGTIAESEIFKNSVLDGEFIKYNKYGKLINLFASFDIYYLNITHTGEVH